jgi:hypothetical protein
MSKENVAIARQPVSIPPQPRRHPEERLALRFPRLTAFALWAFSRLPVHSRLRRELLSLMVRRGIGAMNRGDSGNRVLVLGRMKGRGLSSGAPFDDEWAILLTLSAGRIIRDQVILDHAKALEAAGLQE